MNLSSQEEEEEQDLRIMPKTRLPLIPPNNDKPSIESIDKIPIHQAPSSSSESSSESEQTSSLILKSLSKSLEVVLPEKTTLHDQKEINEEEEEEITALEVLCTESNTPSFHGGFTYYLLRFPLLAYFACVDLIDLVLYVFVRQTISIWEDWLSATWNSKKRYFSRALSKATSYEEYHRIATACKF